MEDSPYQKTGYILRHVGSWQGERKTPKGDTMQSAEPVAELKLSGNHVVKFQWAPTSQSLFLELQRPTTRKDGHNYGFIDGLTLQGVELAAFVRAIASLQGGPELRPAA
jgi:hypothetical protein